MTLKEKFQDGPLDLSDKRIPRGWRYIRIGEMIPVEYLYWCNFRKQWRYGTARGRNNQDFRYNERRLLKQPYHTPKTRNCRDFNFDVDWDWVLDHCA